MATPVTFLKETREELKKVVWPSKQDVVRLTLIVIVISLIVGTLLGAVDFALTKALEIVVK